MKRTLGVALTLLSLVAMLAAPAAFAQAPSAPPPPPPPKICGDKACAGATPTGARVEAELARSQDIKERKRATPPPADRGPATWVTIDEEIVPACSGNVRLTDDALCAAFFSCPEPTFRWFVWHEVTTHSRDENGVVATSVEPFRNIGTYCLGADDPGVPDYGRAISLVTRGFRDLPFPRADVEVAPAPTSLVHVPTAFYAGGEQSFSQTVTPVPGVSVTVTARPVSWTWTWGDGQQQTFDTAGVPRRPVVAHVYEEARDYSASVEVAWRGSFSLRGQTYDIPTPAYINSDPVTVQVREARTQLVDR
jgi:hypothetical protein